MYNSVLSIHDKRIPLLVIENFLPAEVFNKLSSSFYASLGSSDKRTSLSRNSSLNSLNDTSYLTAGGGRGDNSLEQIYAFLGRDSSAFKDVHAIFSDLRFAKQVYSSLGDSYLDRVRLRIRPAGYKVSLFEYLFFKNVYTTYKLSAYPVGSGISIHRDFSKKDVAFLLYFGFSDGENRSVGGTQFYKRRSQLELERLEVDHNVVLESNYCLVHDVSPTPNRLVSFRRNQHSWHGVLPMSPEQFPPNLVRANLQINYMHCDPSPSFALLLRAIGCLSGSFSYLKDTLYSCYRCFWEAIWTVAHPPLNSASSYPQSLSNRSSSLIRNILLRFASFAKITYLFFKGDNLLLDRRRRLIRKAVLRYTDTYDRHLLKCAQYIIQPFTTSKKIKALCFGIYDDFRFEAILSSSLGVEVLAADPTPISRLTYQKVKESHPGLRFMPIALGTKEGEGKFFYAQDDQTSDNFEGSLVNIGQTSKYEIVPIKTLGQFMEIHGIALGDPYILKMDIEGSAIEILKDLLIKHESQGLTLPSQIACEIEIPKTGYEELMFEVSGLLCSLKNFYGIFYVPRMKRFSHLDLLLVRK